MADIELVIKIDEEQYEHIKHMTMDKVKDYHALMYDICERIKNGTLLPKGHGRLGDLDKILKEDSIDYYTEFGCEVKVSALSIDLAPTIIPADEEGD